MHRMRGELGPQDGRRRVREGAGGVRARGARPDPARARAGRAHLLAVPGRRRSRRARAARGGRRDARNGPPGAADHAYASGGELEPADRVPRDRRGQGRGGRARVHGARRIRARPARSWRATSWRCSTPPRRRAYDRVGAGPGCHGQRVPADRRYGFLSDCETGALVAPNGNVEWLCLPRFDSPSVFGAILDRDAGGFRLGPGRRGGARGAPLPAGHERARDELGHQRRLDHRPRRAADRPLAPRARALAHPPPRAHRLRRRPRAAAADPLRERRAPGDDGLRSALRLRPQAGRVGVHGLGLPRGDLHAPRAATWS